jgi:hypothetical protein
MPRLIFRGQYVICNQDIIEKRAARLDDPRHNFCQSMLQNNTYEDYEAAVGSTKVLVQTWSPPGGLVVTVYARDSRNRWIRDA